MPFGVAHSIWLGPAQKQAHVWQVYNGMHASGKVTASVYTQ